MSAIVLPVSKESRNMLSRRRRYVQIKHIAASQLPYRVIKRVTGVTLASFETLEQVADFLLSCNEETLTKAPTNRRRRG